MTRIFQIGVSRCGTVTLYNFFKDNNIKSVHHDFGLLAESMLRRYKKGEKLISPEYEDVIFFSDMTNKNSAFCFFNKFKLIDEQYPRSKFILNTRPMNNWLKTRYYNIKKNDLLDYDTIEEFIETNTKFWKNQHVTIIDYFKERPNDLLIFDIENDNPQKIVDFFKDIYELNADKYDQRHITKNRKINRITKRFGKYESIVHKNYETTISDMVVIIIDIKNLENIIDNLIQSRVFFTMDPIIELSNYNDPDDIFIKNNYHSVEQSNFNKETIDKIEKFGWNDDMFKTEAIRWISHMNADPSDCYILL